MNHKIIYIYMNITYISHPLRVGARLSNSIDSNFLPPRGLCNNFVSAGRPSSALCPTGLAYDGRFGGLNQPNPISKNMRAFVKLGSNLPR